jgi:hypothetical protein
MTDIQIIVTTSIALLTILGGVYTALQARKANRESTVVTGFDSLTKNLQAEVASHEVEIREQSAKIALLERKLDLFVRWGRAVIRWYESTNHSSEPTPLPKPHALLELNGIEGS